MKGIRPGETFATGMVKPKTTALFFDKLWVHPALIQGFNPDDDLEAHRVPAELCVTAPIGASDYYDSFTTQKAYTGWIYQTDVTEALKRLTAETWDLETIFEIEALQHFGEQEPPSWKQLRESLPESKPFLDIDDSSSSPDDNWELYMSTRQRNKAIALIVKLYAGRGIRLTPIYLTALEHDEVTAQENPGLAVCLDHIPTAVDTKLTWDQVSEFRQDKDAVQKLNRLRRWFTLELAQKSESEVKATLDEKIDNYQYALRKHGIQTVLAGTTSVLSFSATPTAAALLTSNPLAALVSGVALASGIVAWIGPKLIERSDLKRDEVAYIYDVTRLADRERSWWQRWFGGQ